MRAAFYEQTGPANEVLQLGEQPTPAAGPGEVRVRVHWSGVNPSDVKSRRGGGAANPAAFDCVIPHSDGAGVIDAVGSGVADSRIGERVWTWNAGWRRACGTAAEYVVLPAQQAVPLADSVDPAAAACFGIPALTACHAVHVDGGVAGKRVLIAGGAGAVGHYAIQFARFAGARQIITTVSSDEKGAVAKAAGADTVVNYKAQDVAAVITDATAGKGVDRIIEVDAGANSALDFDLITDNGLIVVYGNGGSELPVPFFPAIIKNVAMRFFAVYTIPEAARIAATALVQRLAESGDLSHLIAARLKLEQIVEAHELVEHGRVVGNVVLEVT